jgi:hypothetical protein
MVGERPIGLPRVGQPRVECHQVKWHPEAQLVDDPLGDLRLRVDAPARVVASQQRQCLRTVQRRQPDHRAVGERTEPVPAGHQRGAARTPGSSHRTWSEPAALSSSTMTARPAIASRNSAARCSMVRRW